jgi:hypothetical protein
MESPRPPRRTIVRVRVAVGLAFASACTFDPTGLAGEGGGSEADAGDDDDGTGDQPAGCPEPLHVELSVAGRVISPEDPLTTVLLGDTVALSAAGSCSQSGPVTYRWEIDDGDLAATADADLGSQSLSIFPAQQGEYTIRLTVEDGADSAIAPVAALRARPWVARTERSDVRSVALAADRVWIAAADGAFVFDLAEPQVGVQELADVAPGTLVPDNLSTVHFAERSGLVWFARTGNSTQLSRVNLSAAPTTSTVTLSGGPVNVRDIASLGEGALIGHSDGVLSSSNNEVFEPAKPDGDMFAVADNADGGWVGGDDLFRVGSGEEFSPFDEADDKIRALAGAGNLLWVGSDDQGVARFDSDTGVAEVFDKADGLPSNKVRALAVDSAGDVWAATDKGVARYKSDRGVWITMDEDAGLEGLVDVFGIAVLESNGQRVVALGASGGIAILSVEGVPPTPNAD